MAADEKIGRFVKGRYVLEEEEAPKTEAPTEEVAPKAKAPTEEKAPKAEASAEEEKQPTVEDLIKKTSENVDMTIESVVILGKKLFMTEEGRSHIETKTREIGSELQKAVGEIADAAQRFVNKK